MRRKNEKKLGLKKITVANLSDREMNVVLGRGTKCVPTTTIYCYQVTWEETQTVPQAGTDESVV